MTEKGTMYFEFGGEHWLIERSPSCFVSRSGKEDVSVCKAGAWGARQPDGRTYRRCLVLAAEDGALIRSHESVPISITIEYLRQTGFIDNMEDK